MGKEIEHKFLLANDGWREHISRSVRYRQGYMANNDRVSVRARLAGDKAWLNIKSATLGVSRTEFDIAIPVEDAEQMLDIFCKRPFIEKTRHFVNHEQHLWEIDEFDGENSGLIVAEIELNEEGEFFAQPEWAGKDVSLQKRYYNSALVTYPFKDWSDGEKNGD